MASFLFESDDEDSDTEESGKEAYRALYKHMIEDFIHKDDLEAILVDLITLIDPSLLSQISFSSKSNAMHKLRIYDEQDDAE